MPEGDTIHKLAAALAPRFVGQRPARVEFRSGAGQELIGRPILSVFARGKHLFIEFEGEQVLRTHLGMYGSWHRYALRDPWKKPPAQATVVLEIGAEIYVCFNAKECELLRADGVRARSMRARLSIDLVSPDIDISQIPRRAREFLACETPLVDVLLDQRVACGIGNVYKSEVLFLSRLHPATPLSGVADPCLMAVYRRAADLLRRNLHGGPRVTRFTGDGSGALWVYRRASLACFECGAAIVSLRMGRDGRSTYWCPGCRPSQT
jgi:endonuclease-8